MDVFVADVPTLEVCREKTLLDAINTSNISIVTNYSPQNSSEVSVDRLLRILGAHGLQPNEIKQIEIWKEPNLPIHFTSFCYFINVSFVPSSKGLAPLHLFLKKLKPNAVVKEDGDLCIFEKEAKVYTHVLDALQKFYQDRCKQQRCGWMFPKVYYAGELEIYMENLAQKKHVNLDIKKKHDFSEASLVFKSLAQFHAASFVFIKEIEEKKGESFLRLYPHASERMMLQEGVKGTINTFMINSIIKKVTELLKTSNLRGSVTAAAKLDKYSDCAFGSMCEIVGSEQLIRVLNHGDMWSNNIMFAQDDNGNLVHAKFVDLQMTRVGSPSLDLSYYIYNSLHPSARRKQLLSLLNIYYTTFAQTVQSINGTVNFSFKGFLSDYSKISKLGLLFGIYIAAANPLMGKVDLENSKNWIEDFVNAIIHWLDTNLGERDSVLQDVIEMVEDYLQLGEL